VTREEAKTYLAGMVAENKDVIMLDRVQWEDFKTSMLAILDEVLVDPKYQQAVQDINTITDATLP
jgi:hypothetical protein